MIDTSRLASRRVAVLSLTVVLMLIGVIFVVRAASRPAYEATAIIGFDIPRDTTPIRYVYDPRPSPTEVARDLLESAEVAQLASSMVADIEGATRRGPFAWYEPGSLSTDCPSCGLDAASFEKNLRIENGKDRNASQIFVVFGAHDPVVARVGANLVVEAYMQVAATREDAPAVSFGSLAALPTRRADALAWGDVLWFLLVSILAVFLTWRWWPHPQRHMERSHHSAGFRT